MSLRYAVLGVLDAGPMTGYDLSRFFDASAGWAWSATHSQIYPLLNRLADEGLVEQEEQIRGSAQRVVEYSITTEGRDALLSWVGSTHTAPPDRDGFLVQALFFDMVDPGAAIQVLTEYAARHDEAAREATQHADRLAKGTTPLIQERLRRSPESDQSRICRIKAAAFRGRAAVARARAEWATNLIDVIREDTPEAEE